MIRTENFRRNMDNYCYSPPLRGKIDGFLRDGKSGNNKSKHKLVTLRHLCTKCRPIVGSAGSAGPRGPATWTDSDGFFFLERASPTPTWIRPLTCIPSSDNFSHSATSLLLNGSADFGSSIAAALTPLLRVPANPYNSDPTQPDLPSPSSLYLLQMLMRPLSLSQLSVPSLPAEHPPAIFVFGTHRAPTPRLQPGSTSSAKRRARVRRTAYRRRMATQLNPLQPLDDWSPDTSAVALAPRLKRVRPDSPAPARVASPAVRQWLDPSSPNWGEPPPTDGAISQDTPCWFRPSTPPFFPPDSPPAEAPVLPEEHRWPASPPPLFCEPRPISPPGASSATPNVDTPSWIAIRPHSPSWPPPDSPPVVAHVSHAVLPRFGLDSPVDMSAWPDYPPSSPSWGPIGSPTSICSRTSRATPPASPSVTVPGSATSTTPGCRRIHSWRACWIAFPRRDDPALNDILHVAARRLPAALLRAGPQPGLLPFHIRRPLAATLRRADFSAHQLVTRAANLPP
jgi:hypothetical protein